MQLVRTDPAGEKPHGRQIRWHYIYYFLAAFDLVTVLATLLLSHQIMSIYTNSVDVNRLWAERLASYSQLGELATEANAPGNDIFETRNVPVEAARLRAAVAAFDQHLARVRDELKPYADQPEARQIGLHLDAIQTDMAAMVGQANVILAHYAVDEPEAAGAHMAAMDRYYATTSAALADLREYVGGLQRADLDNQMAAANELKKFEYLIAGFIVLMVGCATLYGHTLARRMQQAERERERYVASLGEAEARMRSIFATAADAILIFDARGVIESANASTERIFGRSVAWLTGRPITELIPDFVGRFAGPQAGPALRPMGGGDGVAEETVGLRIDQSTFPIEVSLSAMHLGERRMFTAMVRDVTARKRAEERLRREEALRRSEERFRSLVQHASDIVMVLDADDVIRFVSPSAERLLGYAAGDLLGRPIDTLAHPDDAPCLKPIVWPDDGTSLATMEVRLQHRDGGWRYLELIANNLLDDASVDGIVINGRDVTERKRFEDQLAYQAYHDELTGLPNRALFMERLNDSLLARPSDHGHLAVMFVDLDRFKVINDSLGHGLGDELLVAVAGRLTVSLRPGDVVARFGGDEFTVLLPNLSDPEDAALVAKRLLNSLRRPIRLAARDVVVTASVGIAIRTSDEEDASDLLRHADLALYTAKENGRDRFARYDAQGTPQTVRRLDMETDLRLAIERGQLQVYYQPEVDVDTGEMVGVEALVRWLHPTHGMIAPLEFIPIAEETGLILPIGNWVLTEACGQVACWHRERPEKPPLVLSVNLSAVEFRHPDLAGEVAAVLARTGFPAQNLRLEITESTAMHHVESTIVTLTALKELGVRLAIDDFGTGYSSLSYLCRFALDTIKVDRSFVRGLDEDDRTYAVVEAISALASALRMDLTVEGVETLEQLRVVRSIGCERAQGYYFAKPLPAADLDDLLSVPAGASIAPPEADRPEEAHGPPRREHRGAA